MKLVKRVTVGYEILVGIIFSAFAIFDFSPRLADYNLADQS